MGRFLQLALGLGLCFGIWWYTGPPPIQARPFTPADFQKFHLMEKENREIDHEAAMAQKVFNETNCHPASISKLVARAARTQRLPVKVVASTIVVESSCHSDAISRTGAVGLMQVMPSVWRVSRTELLNPARNIQVGTRILAQYVQQTGDMREGLRRYYGLVDGSDEYADKILEMANGD